MKERTSFTFDKETLKIMDELVLSGKYRNRSHLIEEAIKSLKKEESLNINSKILRRKDE